MKSVIKYKFKKAVGIPGPEGQILMPNIYNKTVKNPINGDPKGAAVQEYNLDEVYEISLLEEEKELPEHISNLGPEVRAAFVQSFAKELADNHSANEAYRKALSYYQEQGHIQILSDSFKDKQKGKLNDKTTPSPSSSSSPSQETVSPSQTGKKTNKSKTSISSS